MSTDDVLLVTMSRHDRDGEVLVRLSGRLDRRSAADVRSVVLGLLGGAGGRVVLDLGETVIGDATALGLLVELGRRAERTGAELSIVAADGRTSRLLHRVRLHPLLVPSPPPAAADPRLARAI